MASKSQQFVYAMRAKYEGKGEMAALSSDLQAMGQIKSFEKLQGDFAQTTASLTDAKAKTRELRRLMNAPGGDAFAAEYEKAAGEVNNLSSKLVSQKAALADSQKAMEDQGFVMGDLAGEYERLDTSTTTHGQKIAAMKTLGVRSFASIEQEVQSLHSAYEILEKDPSVSAEELSAARVSMEADITALTGNTGELVDKWDLMKRGLAAVAALAASGFGLATMAVQAGAAAKDMGNLARVAGTSVEEFSAYAYAVESVGISQENLADISKDVKDKLGDFIATGGGEFSDFFENIAPKVGLTADALRGLSGPDVLVAVKKAMDDANVSAEEQIFYLESIGNDASLLTPLLAENGKALKEKADRARELGIAVSDMDNTKLVEMGVVANDLGKTMSAFSREVISAIAPAIQVLMGHAQNAVVWFNQLSPGVQKFIVFAAIGATAVVAMGVAFAPLITALTLGSPLFISIGAGLAGMTTSMGLGTIASRVLGIAMRGIPLIGIALAVYEIGKAFGIWKPIMDAVHRGAIKLAAGIQMLGLRIRWLWNILTGDFDEADAMEKRMEEVDSITAEMLKNVGKKQDEHLENTKESQAKLTAEVQKGASERLAIEQEAQKQISKLPSDKEEDKKEEGKKEEDKKEEDKKKEEPDEFGILPSERKSMDDELAKLDAVRGSKNGSGYKKEKNDDGTWGVALEPSLATRSERRLADLPKLEPKNSNSSSGDNASSKKVVELKLGGARLQGDQAGVDSFIEELSRAGMQVS